MNSISNTGNEKRKFDEELKTKELPEIDETNFTNE